MKYVFKWTTTNEVECWEHNIPFECEDLDLYLINFFEKAKGENWIHFLGILISADEISLIESSIFTLEDWFNKNKF